MRHIKNGGKRFSCFCCQGARHKKRIKHNKRCLQLVLLGKPSSSPFSNPFWSSTCPLALATLLVAAATIVVVNCCSCSFYCCCCYCWHLPPKLFCSPVCVCLPPPMGMCAVVSVCTREQRQSLRENLCRVEEKQKLWTARGAERDGRGAGAYGKRGRKRGRGLDENGEQKCTVATKAEAKTMLKLNMVIWAQKTLKCIFLRKCSLKFRYWSTMKINIIGKPTHNYAYALCRITNISFIK